MYFATLFCLAISPPVNDHETSTERHVGGWRSTLTSDQDGQSRLTLKSDTCDKKGIPDIQKLRIRVTACGCCSNSTSCRLDDDGEKVGSDKNDRVELWPQDRMPASKVDDNPFEGYGYGGRDKGRCENQADQLDTECGIVPYLVISPALSAERDQTRIPGQLTVPIDVIEILAP